ncbi:MAG: DsbA family protein [Actinobacteria bacterium]|nr:DsbA family protein [Actinomycetota bacterium]
MKAFSITFDYRCPFARNANEHVLLALEAGKGWDVTFLPFSLDQVHLSDADPAVWDGGPRSAGLIATETALVVSKLMPERFRAVHRSLFAARHDQARDLRDLVVVKDVLINNGVDIDQVMTELDSGWPLEQYRKAHESAVADYGVFGVPTFIVDNQAAFVRIMTRPEDDKDLAVSTIERVLDIVSSHPELNEIKHTSAAR